MVAVAHPNLLAPLEEPALEEVERLIRGRHEGAAELGGAVARLHLAPQHVHHRLLAVADAQHRHAQVEHLARWQRRALREDRGRAPRQDHRLGRELPQEPGRDGVERVDLAVDVQLAQGGAR
jgi:hypothetical protein